MAEKVIKLNKPKIEDAFMKGVQERKSCREYDPNKELTIQQISEILWCTYGNNRQNKIRQKHHFLAYKTVPSACGTYPLKIYAVTKKGIYFYDPDNEELRLVKEGNFMKYTGSQAFVPDCSLNIYIIFNYRKRKEFPNERIAGIPKEIATRSALVEAGCVSQNISLYCTLNGLSTVVRGEIGNVEKMRELLNLDEYQEPILAHCVGFYKSKEENNEFKYLK